jgi:hypothetical protein
VTVPRVLSRPEAGGDAGLEVLRDFLETLVESAAKQKELVIGEAEPGRYMLVSPPLDNAAMQEQIDGAVAHVLERLGQRWPAPHVTDFGLRETYANARDPWLARRGFEALVKEGKLGVVTIFCHEWVYEVCAQVAAENGLGLESPLEEYLRTGKLRLAGKNAFQLDVFTNLRDMAANFDTVDALATKVLVLVGLSEDEALAARLRGNG